ncbi:MAG: WYL domain-containing protein [Candidatus Bipolaricaulota bacterium]
MIDSLACRNRRGATGSLPILYEATLGDRWARAAFARQFGATTRNIAPYGLASKAGEGYVIWAGEDDHIRVDTVFAIRRAGALATPFSRPAAFDLQTFWDEWKEREEERQPSFDVRLRVRKDAVAYVHSALEDRRKLLALGGAVEVVHPPALRASLEDFANQICRVYEASYADVPPRTG